MYTLDVPPVKSATGCVTNCAQRHFLWHDNLYRNVVYVLFIVYVRVFIV